MKEIIIKLIVDDFDKSPSIGYIRINQQPNVIDSGNLNHEIANPFASINTVNEKIEPAIYGTLKTHTNLNISSSIEIKCNFSDVLDYFKCNIYK